MWPPKPKELDSTGPGSHDLAAAHHVQVDLGVEISFRSIASTDATASIAHASEAGAKKKAPGAVHRRVTASVVEDAARVVHTVIDEAQRRDPDRAHDWVALVDGNNLKRHILGG